MIAVVVALLAAAAVTAVIVLRSAPRAPGMLADSYPTAPAAAWVVDIETATGDPDVAFTSPFYDVHQGGDTGYFEYDGALVVRVIHTGVGKSDPHAYLAAVDSVDGHIRWTSPVSREGGCAHEPWDGALACLVHESDERSVLRYIDLADGSVRAESTTDFTGSAVAVANESVYLLGYDQNTGESVVSRGSVDDPQSGWRRDLPALGCDSPSTPDRMEVSGDFVALRGFGSGMLLRTADGSTATDDPLVAAHLVDGVEGALVTTCADRGTARIVQVDGTAIPVEGYVLEPALTVSDTADLPLITDRFDAVDPRTGTSVWSVDSDGTARGAAVVGDLVVIETSDSDLRAYDLGTGEQRWTSTGNTLGVGPVTDGERILTVDGSTVIATSLTDGSVAWSMEAGSASEVSTSRLAAVDAGLVFVSDRELRLYTAPGGTAPVPGSPADSAVAQQSPQAVTRCGTPPRLTPVGLRIDEGGLVVTMRFTATCPTGDVLAAASTRIAISTGGSNVAAAAFDFTTNPIVIPRPENTTGFTTRELRFPVGAFWRLPDDLPEPAEGTQNDGGSAGTFLVECEPSGRNAVESASVESSTESRRQPVVDASGPARPITGDPESASFDALRAIADADLPVVQSDLAERWVPQLSSKRPGLQAEGRTWNNAATLEEHLVLRLRYPNVRLLWSGDWSTFSAPDFWVTIAGSPSSESGSAVTWCDQQRLDAEHCYAKLVSRSHPVDGSTVLR
ncbi:outer membrane protein assembly factor BamB family protein [Rhodococcus pyridinivorans]